jgi:hypothetical protein
VLWNRRLKDGGWRMWNRERDGTNILGRHLYELWKLIMKPFPILEEVIFIPAVELIPIFSGSVIVLF